MARKVASREAARATRFTQYTVQHFASFEDLAHEHASKRNNAIVRILAYLAQIRTHRPDLRAEEIHENEALWQNAKSHRVPRPVGNYEIDWDPQRGYALNEAAHWVPCSLVYQGQCISALCDNDYAVQLVRTPFAEVSDLPAIFNDADQRAEDAGLRRMLERAARKIVAEQRPGANVDYALIERTYTHVWKPGALAAYSQSIIDIYPLWAMERLRRSRVERTRQSGIDPADLEIDRDQGFYATMNDILRGYEHITTVRTPLDLQRPALEAHVRALETAGDPNTRTRWPSRLELA